MRESKIALVFLGILAFLAAGFLLQTLKPILLPFVVALFLAQIFSPLTKALRRRRVPAAISVLLVLALVTGVLVLLSMVIYSSADAFTTALPEYQAKLKQMAQGIAAWVGSYSRSLQAQIQHWKWDQGVQVSSLTGFLTTTVGSFLLFFNDAFLIILFLVFLLAGSESFPHKLRAAMPDQAERVGEVMSNIETGVRKYLLTKTLLNAVNGTIVGLLLWGFGVDFPLLWGFLTFLAHYIPNFGAVISVGIPTIFMFLQFSPGKAILVALLNLAVQFTIGNALEPRVMGSSLNLSPLLVLFSLIFWGWLWGPWGMVLSVPITSMIKIVCEHVPALRPLAVLMSGSEGRQASLPSRTGAGQTRIPSALT
ncbi:MAG: transport protein TqsA [Acidobacteriota bacterium]|jgi:predicted PurR-regulated permease PerM|nr:transport protein TqsA [Acidobacteriota bacterium]